MEVKTKIKIFDGEKYFFRFTLNQRLQHIILAATVIILVLTGMPLKFHDAGWAHFLYAMFGGIKVAPYVHKTAGTIMLMLFVYHVGYLIYLIYKFQVAPLRRSGELSWRAPVRAVPRVLKISKRKTVPWMWRISQFPSTMRPANSPS